MGADAQTKVTIGKVIGGDGFHVPTYVALDEGFFKAEGLDVTLVELQAPSQVTAVLSGNLDCAPIPSGGAQAALSGAKIEYIVGESLKSQWTVTTRQDIAKPEDLKGKTLGFGRPGGADYDEAQAVLHRFFHMDAGKDYKVISFQGEAERIAAMVNNDIQGAALSVPLAVVAEQSGLKVLLRTGDYIPRAGGTIWCMQSFVEQHPDTVKKIIRAIAKAVMYFRTNKEGSIKVLEHHIGSIKNDAQAGAIWDQLHEFLRRRGAEGSVRGHSGVAPPDHDRRAAMAGRQAIARSGRVFGAQSSRLDAEGHELRAGQSRRADEIELMRVTRFPGRSAAERSGALQTAAYSDLDTIPDLRCTANALHRVRKRSNPRCPLRAPAAHALFEELDQPGHDKRQRREHDQAGEHHVDLEFARGADHDHAEPVLRAEEFRYDDAEHGAADREP